MVAFDDHALCERRIAREVYFVLALWTDELAVGCFEGFFNHKMGMK